MKKIDSLFKIMFLLAIAIFFTSCLTQKEKEENIKIVTKSIKENNFKFVAQQANPMRGNLIPQTLQNLDGTYYLIVTKDSINSYLPYFGVAQQVPYGSENNGLQFINTEFSYDKKDKGNGNYEITIIPKKSDKFNRLFLTISDNGTALLNVTSNQRDPISFTGIIVKR